MDVPELVNVKRNLSLSVGIVNDMLSLLELHVALRCGLGTPHADSDASDPV